MEKYIKYILISLFLVFSIFYTNKVIEISQYNNTILASINDYASKNDYSKNISIVINIESGKYFNKMLDVSESKNIEINLLMNTSFLRDNITDNYNHSNILYKGNSLDDLNSFIGLLHNEFFCVKTNDYEIINDCKSKKINSIKMSNEIKKDLLINTKKLLNNGVIIFIRENEFNLSELSSTINYIKSRGFTIVNINELLS